MSIVKEYKLGEVVDYLGLKVKIMPAENCIGCINFKNKRQIEKCSELKCLSCERKDQTRVKLVKVCSICSGSGVTDSENSGELIMCSKCEGRGE